MSDKPISQLSLMPAPLGGAISDRLLLDEKTIFGHPPLEALCIVFARCNMACPSCCRGSQHEDPETKLTVGARSFSFDHVVREIETEMQAAGAYPGIKKIPYLTGGDPSTFIRESVALAKYFADLGVKIGFAHNGFSAKFARAIAPYSQYAAIDIKASRPHEFEYTTGVKSSLFSKYMQEVTQVLRILASHDVFTEVRYPIFDFTQESDMDEVAAMASGEMGSNSILLYRIYLPSNEQTFVPRTWSEITEIANRISARHPSIKIGCLEGFSLNRKFALYAKGDLIDTLGLKGVHDFSSIAHNRGKFLRLEAKDRLAMV